MARTRNKKQTDKRIERRLHFQLTIIGRMYADDRQLYSLGSTKGGAVSMSEARRRSRQNPRVHRFSMDQSSGWPWVVTYKVQDLENGWPHMGNPYIIKWSRETEARSCKPNRHVIDQY